jgi:hypothetical protein
VDVLLRRGRIDNEPTKYHYDVILQVGPKAVAADAQWVQWDAVENLENARNLLSSRPADVICIADVPNARLKKDVEALRLIEEGAVQRIQELKDALASIDGGIHPEDVCTLGESAGYEVDLRYSDNGVGARFDVIFRKKGSERRFIPPRHAVSSKRVSDYGNNPANKLSTKGLPADLRQYLGAKLPDYMIPAAFVMIDAFPMTPNGKVDRRALPAPRVEDVVLEKSYVAPKTEIEKQLADIWRKVLHLDCVGMDDDIFNLGGDSLLIFQIATRAVQAGIRITPRQIFQHRTISGLAMSLQQESGHPEQILPTLKRVERKAVRFKRTSN